MKFVLLFICLHIGVFAACPNLETVFTNVYETKLWSDGTETISGQGSMIAYTNSIREALPKIFVEYNIKSVLDLPCGDFNWMKEIDYEGMTYHGGDIVAPIVKSNQEKYTKENITFSQMNAVTDNLKAYDLIICRDLLLHLTHKNILKVLHNLKKSGSKYLLLSTAPKTKFWDLPEENGQARAVDLEHPRYGMGKPILKFYDDYAGRYIGLWKNEHAKNIE